MKTCKICGVPKDESEFSALKNGGTYSYCKPCNSKRQREQYDKRRSMLVGTNAGAAATVGKRISATRKRRAAIQLGDDILDILNEPTHEDQREAAAIVGLL